MPLHPKLQAMIDKAAGLPPLQTLAVEAIRATDMARYAIGVPKDEVGRRTDANRPESRTHLSKLAA